MDIIKYKPQKPWRTLRVRHGFWGFKLFRPSTYSAASGRGDSFAISIRQSTMPEPSIFCVFVPFATKVETKKREK